MAYRLGPVKIIPASAMRSPRNSHFRSVRKKQTNLFLFPSYLPPFIVNFFLSSLIALSYISLFIGLNMVFFLLKKCLFLSFFGRVLLILQKKERFQIFPSIFPIPFSWISFGFGRIGEAKIKFKTMAFDCFICDFRNFLDFNI